jgi:hypothetical protein
MTARREVAESVVPCEVIFRYCVVVAGRRLVSMCTTRLITLKLHIFPCALCLSVLHGRHHDHVPRCTFIV